MRVRRDLPAAIAVRALLVAAAAATGTAQEVSFAREVLPLLSDRCFSCHGPDAAARKKDLRLDEREGLFGDREGRTVVAPGRPDASELIARITTTNVDDAMPPRDSGLALAPAEVALLRRWVEQGAPWSVHWSFAPTESPDLPAVALANWPRTPIDRFVLARLEQEGLAPNPPAEPAALLRRVTLDLTGLPPTPAELDAFLADPSDAAYERVVDRLLASPRYGERMAWPWLEAARYADTDGYQGDPTRTVWPWRDWLVRALNANVPFDRFTVEVLAGDLLPAATPEQRLATGFLRNNAHNGEGGRIAEETRVENVFDRTEAVATVWMGLTFECARCHDHRFDPIAQRDYYRLFAFFDRTSEQEGQRTNGQLAPTMRWLESEAARRRVAELEVAIAKLDGELLGDDAALAAQEAEWLSAEAERVRRATAGLAPSELGPWLRSEPFRAAPDAMFAEVFAPERTARLAEDHGFVREPALVDGTPFALPDGAFTTYFARTIRAATARRMTVSLGSDDAIKVFCNGELVLQRDVRRGVQKDQDRAEVVLAAGDNHLLLKVVNTGGIGGVYFRRVDETVPDLPTAVARALVANEGERTPDGRRALRQHFRRTTVAGFREREDERDRLAEERSELEKNALDVLVLDDLPPGRRRTTRVLERGNYQAPREAVTAGTPSFLPPLETNGDAEPDRLALARWLVSGRHPLTARVAVNRAWQTIFGRGLVATSEDFGRQGERPSHPELLDWLAEHFVASGWNTKALHRLLVTSATYRQSAAASAEAFADDPHDARLARSARTRLPAWMLRDQALALSGRLVTRLGGPPVRPYQPDGVWTEATFGQIRYEQGHGEEPYRRSLYVFWRRIVGPTVFFDTPARQTCLVRSATTNTPLHALTTTNETGFVEDARGLAERAWRAAGEPRARIEWLFRAATARAPDEKELQLLARRLDASRSHFTNEPAKANALLTVGDAPPPADVPADELAALTIVAGIVLNLDEVLTRP